MIRDKMIHLLAATLRTLETQPTTNRNTNQPTNQPTNRIHIMTILEILAARKAAAQAANHPATVARSAGNAALTPLRPLPCDDNLPPRKSPVTSTALAPLPPPVRLVSESAALARLFPVIDAATEPGGTVDQDIHAARAEWLRSTMPYAVAVDQGGAVFFPERGIDSLAPYAAAIMAAEREAAENARALTIGKVYQSARANGASHAEAAKLLAGVAG